MRAKKTILLVLWILFTFVAPIAFILTEFIITDEPMPRIAMTGAFVFALLFLAYKRLLVARFTASDTPLARLIRTMDAIIPLLIFAVMTIMFGEWLRYLGGVVGVVWASLAVGAGFSYWRGKCDGGGNK